MAWLDATLMAMQRTAVSLGRHQFARQLARTLNTFHDRRGRGHDPVTAWRAALDQVSDTLDHIGRPTTPSGNTTARMRSGRKRWTYTSNRPKRRRHTYPETTRRPEWPAVADCG